MAHRPVVKVGDKFGEWTVLEPQGKKILCECSCEEHTQKLVYKYDLLDGKSASCGCSKKNKDLPDVKEGDVFGRWTILKVDGVFSECECSCDEHTKKRVKNYTLQTGASTCCGCIKKEENKAAVEIGKMYYNWKVIAHAGRDSFGSNLIECECQCEKKTRTTMTISTLLRGRSKRCGCETDIRTGDKFGRWTVLDKTNTKQSSRSDMWRCQCECGEIREVLSSALRNGRSKSCGCLTREIVTIHGLSHTKEYKNEKHREWAKRNPDKCAAKVHRYRARKQQASPYWAEERTNKAVENLNKQKRKLKAETGKQHEIDHIVPLTGKIKGTEFNVVSGLHVWYNLQVLLGSDNGSKNSYGWPDSWDYTQEDIDFIKSVYIED